MGVVPIKPNTMLCITIAVMVGVVLAHFKESISSSSVFYTTLSALIAYSLWADWKGKNQWPMVMLILVGCGFAMAIISDKQTANTIPYNHKCEFTATATSKATINGKYYVLECQTLSYKDSTNIWRKENQQIELHIDTSLRVVPQIGNTITMSGKLRYIDGPYGDWMRSKGTIGKVYSYRATILDSTLSPKTVSDKIYYWQNKTADRINALDTTNHEATAIMSALTIGYKNDMPKDTKQEYQRAGVSHLLAISGLHVGIMVTILNMMFGFVRLWRHGRVVFGIMVIILIWLYALFTGMSPSVIRASIMFTLFQIGIMTSRGSNKTSILSSAALIILIIDPKYLFNIGFQLSFLAMVGITTMYRPLTSLINTKNRAINALWSVSVVSIAAQVAVMPLVAYYFGQIPLMGLVINIGVWITVPTIIMGTLLYLATSLAMIGSLTMSVAIAQNYMISIVAQQKWATIQGVKLPIWALLSIYAIEIAVATIVITATQKRLRRKVLSAKYNF